MTIVQMGKHKYKKSIGEDGNIHFSRLPKHPPAIHRKDLPEDVAGRFMKCNKGVDYKYIKRRDLQS